MNKLKLMIASALVAVGVLTAVPVGVYAQIDPAAQIQQGVKDAGGGDPAKKPTLQARVAGIVNVLLFVLGAIAVIMIIIGGIRYVVSNGDSSAVTGAKNTIFYAVIGLVVAMLAYAIVNFVVTNIK